MVTKYDVFEVIYKNHAPLKPVEILKILKKEKSEYKNIYRIVNELEKENLVTRNKEGVQTSKSQTAQSLYDLIEHCIHNNINYNLLVDKNVVKFIYGALKKKKSTAKR